MDAIYYESHVTIDILENTESALWSLREEWSKLEDGSRIHEYRT
jgi:hypothetical protein